MVYKTHHFHDPTLTKRNTVPGKNNTHTLLVRNGGLDQKNTLEVP